MQRRVLSLWIMTFYALVLAALYIVFKREFDNGTWIS